MIRFLRLLLYLSLLAKVSVASGQKSDPKMEAIERHYNSLEGDTKAFREAMQKENEAYREFIQEERAEHQNFLERAYIAAGIVVGVIGLSLTFFGWNTFEGIKSSRKEIESVATNRLLEFEKSMENYRLRYAEAEQGLKQAEIDYNQYLSYYKDSNPRKGRYLVIGTNERLKNMKVDELVRFAEAFDGFETMSIEEKNFETYQLASFSLIIYRFQPDSEGEDSNLQDLLDAMSILPEKPLVVYAKQGERIENKTQTKLSQHKLFSIANNPITLIDNVASAYRVAKMLPKPTKSV